MSERMNVDHAFDPEARKAQADLDAYSDTRPYQDAKGNTHSPDDGSFADVDTIMDARRQDHYDESLRGTDYSGESLEQLAQRVAEANQANDKTMASDAEEAFFSKFTEYSEKYGWENENIDESATSQLVVDKNAKIGRDTIDARLERYGKIMYGEATADSATAEVVGATSDKAVLPDTEKVPDKNETKDEPIAETAASISIDDQAEEAKAKAKVDRELLTPISTDILEPVDASKTESGQKTIDDLELVDGPTAEPSLEGESLGEYKESPQGAAALSLVETDILEPVDAETEEVSETNVQTRRQKTAGILRHPGAAVGAFIATRGAEHQAGAANEKMSKRKKRLLGAAALVGMVGAGLAISYLKFNGHDTSAIESGNSGGGGGTIDGFKGVIDNMKDIDASSVADSSGVDTASSWSFDDSGAGTSLLESQGMDPSVWYEHQDEFLKQFPDVAYRMSDGNVGLLDQGAGASSKLPQAAQAFWERFNR